MREQFRLQPRLSESLNVGIRLGDIQYTLETEVFEELQDRKPIVIDPTLVRAAQLADTHLLNEAKERGNDLKFLVQMCFGGKVSTNSFEAESCRRTLPRALPNKSATISVHLE